jgi:hypothetical protein
MIGMFMGKQNGIETVNFVAQHLLPEIGTHIHNDPCRSVFDHYGTPEPFILKIN